MFNLFKKKDRKDPILEMLENQTRQLEEINRSLSEHRDEIESDIAEAEKHLKALGYTDEDLNKIKNKSKIKIVND